MNSKIKKLLAVALLSFSSINFSVASGIPTVDAGAIAQMVQQLTQMQQMYSQMQSHYNTAVSTLSNFTGTRGLGMLNYDLNLRSLIPADVQVKLSSILNGASTLSDLGQTIFNRFNMGAVCENLEGESKSACLQMQNYKAEITASLEQSRNVVSQRLQNIEFLMSRINTATDAKAIADLSARIQAEQVALSASQMAAQYQQAQMAEQQKMVEKEAKRKMTAQMFPQMTSSDLKKYTEK